MPWEQRFATGHDGIDRQHLTLFKLIDAVQAASADDFSDGVQVVLDLVKYVIDHFAYEQELMERLAYPGKDAHLRAHALLIEQVKGFRDQVVTGDLTLARLHAFLDGWIQHHIGVEDVKLGAFLAGRT